MGLTQNRPNPTLGSIGSTLVLVVGTEQLYKVGTGKVAIEVTNLGPNVAYYGNTGVQLTSGGYLGELSSKYWDNISDDFTLALVCIDVAQTTRIIIHEYEGR